MNAKYYWFILLLLANTVALANEQVTISSEQSKVDLSQALYVYEDPTSKLTLKDILSPAFDQRFVPLSQLAKKSNNLGFSQSNFWIKFTLKNNSTKRHWFIQNHDNIKQIAFYERANNNTIHQSLSGASIALASRPYYSHHVVFPIEIPPNSQHDYYLQIQSLTPVIADLSLVSESALIRAESAHNILSGTVLGVMLVLLLVNLLFYAILKFNSQLYLIIYTLAALFAYTSQDGYLLYLLPTSLIHINAHIFFAAASISFISLYFYFEHLLFANFSSKTKNVMRYTISGYWGLVVLLSYTTTLQLPYKMQIIGSAIFPLLGALYSGYVWFNKQHQARFIFIGLCCLTLGQFLQMTQQLGLTDLSQISHELNQFGNIMLITLLSIAIVDYVRHYQRMQKKTMHQVKQAEDKFKRVFEQAYQMLFLVAKDGEVITVNNEALRFLNQTKSALLQRNFTEVFTSLKGVFDQDNIRKNIAKALQGELVTQNIVAYYNNESLKDLELSFQPYVNNQPDIGHVLVQARDITKQVQAFKAIQDMVVGIVGLSPENFFKKFLIEISRIYNAKYVMLSQLNDTTPVTATTVAIIKDKRPSPNFTYAIAGSPSEEMLSKSVCNYPNSIGQKFPNDEWLIAHQIESYLGVNIKDSNNNIVGFLSVMNDKPLDEDNYFIEVLNVFAARIGNELRQQEAQDALKTALQKLDFHITHTPLGVIEWDENFNIIKWNKAAEKIFGYSLEHFKNKNPIEVLLPKGEIANVIEVGKALKKQKGGRYSLNKNLTASGEEILCEWYNTPLLDDDGKLIGVASLVNDVTAEHHALNALYIKEQEQREVFNALTDAVFIIDEQGTIISTNNAGETLFDYPVDQLVEHSASHLLTGKYAKGYQKYLKYLFNCLSKQNETITSELDCRKQNGEIFPVSLTLTVLPNDSLGRPRLLATCHDLTESKIQQESLRQSQKMDALGNLTGGIAHDFNNLLGIIGGYAELLTLKTKQDQPLAQYADHILKASKRGAKLTQKLLSFARKNIEEKQLVNINKVLLDNFDMLQKTITPRINLTYSLLDTLPLTNIDKAELEDSILNLSINAMHAIKKNGEIIISTSVTELNKQQAALRKILPGKYIELSVKDNGVGMSEQTQQKALEPFFTTKGNTGTGLGLSQVYGFVERSSGFIHIDSHLGKGTKITINLPVTLQQAIEQPEPVTTSVTPVAGATILVVDDEPSLVELSKNILSNAGYQVVTANSGQQALNQLAQHPIDAILCDVIMPNMGGNELAEIVQKKYPDIAILFVSGYYERSLEKTHKITSEQVLKKPYRANELLQRIAQCLTQKQLSTAKQVSSN